MFNNWFISGMASAVCFSIMILIYKKLLLMGIKPLVLNLCMFGIVFFGFIIWNISTKTTFNFDWKIILFLLVAAAFSLLGNYFETNSVRLAPNPGYAATLKSTQIIFISLLAPILFRSAFGIVPVIGIGLVLVGIFLISK